jgi:tetratricopeptide (TPR) repeat protein
MRWLPTFVILTVLSISASASAQDPNVPWYSNDQRYEECGNGDRAACMETQFGNCAHDNPRIAITACTRQLAQQDNREHSVNTRFERAMRYALRADAYGKQGDLDRSIEDYERATNAFGGAAWIYALRAIALRRAGEYEAALASYNEAIRLEPNDPNHLIARAQLHSMNGENSSALDSYDEAITIEPDNAIFLIARAWLLSTSPEDDVRNGPLAVIDTLAAIELESDTPPVFLDTLAAAYAESGDFAKAVEIQQWMLALLRASPRKSNERAIEIYETRLDLYLREMPYREIHCASITLGDVPPYCQFELEPE